jgi:hypothetical protein
MVDEANALLYLIKFQKDDLCHITSSSLFRSTPDESKHAKISSALDKELAIEWDLNFLLSSNLIQRLALESATGSDQDKSQPKTGLSVDPRSESSLPQYIL